MDQYLTLQQIACYTLKWRVWYPKATHVRPVLCQLLTDFSFRASLHPCCVPILSFFTSGSVKGPWLSEKVPHSGLPSPHPLVRYISVLVTQVSGGVSDLGRSLGCVSLLLAGLPNFFLVLLPPLSVTLLLPSWRDYLSAHSRDAPSVARCLTKGSPWYVSPHQAWAFPWLPLSTFLLYGWAGRISTFAALWQLYIVFAFSLTWAGNPKRLKTSEIFQPQQLSVGPMNNMKGLWWFSLVTLGQIQTEWL